MLCMFLNPCCLLFFAGPVLGRQGIQTENSFLIVLKFTFLFLLLRSKIMDSCNISNILQTYKDVVLYPTPVSAVMCKQKQSDRFNVYSLWKMPDVIQSEHTTFTKEYVYRCQSNTLSLLNDGIPVDNSTVSKQVFAKSGNKYAIFRTSKKSEEAIFLEIWSMLRKESTFDLTDSKKHGAVQYGSFGAFEWSASERYLLYVADVHQEKSESYFKDFFCEKSTTEEKTEEKPKIQGEEFAYKESWGETNMKAHHTVLCIFDVTTGSVDVLNLDDKFPNVSIGQATWGPNDECIVFVGHEEAPFRLGLIHCINRRSAIYSYNVKNKTAERLIFEEDTCAESPIFSPDFKTLVYLQNKAFGPHFSARKIMKCDWESKEIKTVVNDVDEELPAEVFCLRLNKRWTSDSRFLFFDSKNKSYTKLYYADLQEDKLGIVESPSDGSLFLLDVKDPYIVAYSSSPNQPPTLNVGVFTSNSGEIDIVWNTIENNFKSSLLDVTWKLDTLQPTIKDEKYTNLNYEIITVWSTEKRNDSLIIIPHGGPHSLYDVSYFPTVAALAKLGFAICLVNYRGSSGFGQNSIKSLPGKVGTLDVSDVVNAIEFVKNKKELNIKQVFGYGGSHGGFLIAHIVGQYPDLLSAACIANPVIDLPSCFVTSDIPDWAYVEAGISEYYDRSKLIEPGDLERMWEKSPIRFVKNVKTPTLLLLGKSDLRVNPSQGMLFYRYLRAQNVPTKVYSYEDNHSLSKVGHSTDCFVHEALWFLEYLNKTI